MDTKFTVGIIGAGKPWRTEGATGFGMGHIHADGYNATGKCEIIAVCDIVEERAAEFSREHSDGQAIVFTDYRQMLEKASPDIVSICTWPHLHAPMVAAACAAGARAIWCEKPMADTFGDAQAMAEAARRSGTVLIFDHQRRFLDTFQNTRRLLDDGAIGQLVRLEGACGDFMDWGTHWMNMFLFYLHDAAAPRWVMGQVDARREKRIFGLIHDTHGQLTVRFDNGVTGVLWVGEEAHEIVGCENRLIGTDGWIEVHNHAPHVRWRGKGDENTRALDGAATAGGLHGSEAYRRAAADLIHSLETGTKPLLDVSNALPTTEILFAAYESARRRGRIDLPLTITDHPLAAMVAEGIFPNARSF
jgi:predicted dehydrogenase